MGGHGGLNILPQKKWNVYNWDNRIKVMENEKLVKKEISKLEKRQKDKNLSDRVKIIKNKEIDSHHNNKLFNEIDDKEKTKMFKEVMSRKSMENKLNVDLFFEKMNTPMPKEKQLKLFDDELNIDKIINSDLEGEEKQITIKESLKKELIKPWYMQKRMEDFEIYKEIELKKDEENNLLNKKHKKDKKEKKHKKDKKFDKDDLIEKLRKERILREKEEKERIENFINNLNKIIK